MVNTLSHLGIGFLIALALGFKGKKRNEVAFMSILPDLDFIPYAVFALIAGSISHEARNQLFYLFGHREFMHSILFILLVTLLIWLKTKDHLFTVAGLAAILSHVYLDYATSWKMRPFYPFSTETSTLGAVHFFDPLANQMMEPLQLPFDTCAVQNNHAQRDEQYCRDYQQQSALQCALGSQQTFQETRYHRQKNFSPLFLLR